MLDSEFIWNLQPFPIGDYGRNIWKTNILNLIYLRSLDIRDLKGRAGLEKVKI